jgi:hypothetical protein
LVVPFFALSSPTVVEALRKFYDNRLHGGLLAALLLIPFVLLALPTAGADPQNFGVALLRLSAYIFIPTLAMLYRPAHHRPLDVFDVTVIIALWFPIEFDWLPDVSAPLAPGLNLPVAKLMGVLLAFLLFLVLRPTEGVGYSYALTRADVVTALKALGMFAVVGLPLGFALRFVALGFAPVAPGQWLVSLVAIFFLIGVPEELLFRGIIQNLIEQRFGGRTWPTLIVSALIFGAAHLDNATTGYPVPNWAYMLMATLAGVAYGWAWRKSGKITAAALTHAGVDWIWGVVLGG